MARKRRSSGTTKRKVGATHRRRRSTTQTKGRRRRVGASGMSKGRRSFSEMAEMLVGAAIGGVAARFFLDQKPDSLDDQMADYIMIAAGGVALYLSKNPGLTGAASAVLGVAAGDFAENQGLVGSAAVSGMRHRKVNGVSLVAGPAMPSLSSGNSVAQNRGKVLSGTRSPVSLVGSTGPAGMVNSYYGPGA